MYFDGYSSYKSVQNDEDLKAELKRFGFNPGPIVDSTRSLYMKKLEEYKKGYKCDNVKKLSSKLKVLKVNDQSPKKTYRIRIDKCLHNADWIQNLTPFIKLEEKARHDFADPRKQWPGDYSKKSFTYLLLDPRITRNLPARAARLSLNSQWTTFIDSIFYVGKEENDNIISSKKSQDIEMLVQQCFSRKSQACTVDKGKNERPYKHLTEAKPLWEKFKTSEDKKIQYILDIWENNMGVICLQVFHNLIPVEAYTYEAAMIDALGLKTLTNLKSGSYSGVVELWPFEEKRMLGIYLLYKAMRNYLNENERQLRPEDL